MRGWEGERAGGGGSSWCGGCRAEESEGGGRHGRAPSHGGVLGRPGSSGESSELHGTLPAPVVSAASSAGPRRGLRSVIVLAPIGHVHLSPAHIDEAIL